MLRALTRCCLRRVRCGQGEYAGAACGALAALRLGCAGDLLDELRWQTSTEPAREISASWISASWISVSWISVSAQKETHATRKSHVRWGDFVRPKRLDLRGVCDLSSSVFRVHCPG
ncbi:MAG TPA: hypothetical protein DCY79_20365 [Planctomycetaceae bacterium]|nr:hypothetical protein [Planctomycetaceae bacterium]